MDIESKIIIRYKMEAKKNSYIVDFGEGQHVVGRFNIKGKYYIILINAKNGNRWQEPTSISEDDMILLEYGVRKNIKRIVFESLAQSGLSTHSLKKLKIKVGF
jgi:hypothetical protein